MLILGEAAGHTDPQITAFVEQDLTGLYEDTSGVVRKVEATLASLVDDKQRLTYASALISRIQATRGRWDELADVIAPIVRVDGKLCFIKSSGSPS